MRLSDQEANRLHVLKAIRRSEPVARTELVKITGLSSAAISDITGELLQRGLLLEVRAQAPARGRPRMQLLLNPDAAYVAGVFLGPDGGVAAEISNARGEPLATCVISLGQTASLEALVDHIREAVDDAIAQSKLRKDQISSVGVSLPGTIDSIGGVLHWLESFPISAAPIAAMLGERLQLPVSLENNTDVIARAEHWFGSDRQVDDFSLFTVGLGLGFSQYVDGRPTVGAHGLNAEIGHVKVSAGEGPICVCGSSGCLLTSATMFGAALRLCELRNQPRPGVAHVVEVARNFAREARDGATDAREVFQLVGRNLGLAVANHINMSDPARVLILVEDAVFADLIAAPFYTALQDYTFPPMRGRVPVQFTVNEDLRWSQGAAALVLERLYSAGPARAVQPMTAT